MYFRGPAVGLTFCFLYLASYFTNKYVLSILKFTYPTLFQGWQTLVGGVFLHIYWKIGWVEINCTSRSDIKAWLPASAFFVGIIYAGSRALSRLPIPVFLTLHSTAEVVTYAVQRVFYREQSSYSKTCSVILLLISAVCLPLHDSQFDKDGYFWAVVHLICSGFYKVFQKTQKSSELDQQYINYIFSIVLLASASHPTGDLLSALEFPFLYFYRFHGGCCASGILGFLLMLLSVKLRSSLSPAHHLSWNFIAKGNPAQPKNSLRDQFQKDEPTTTSWVFTAVVSLSVFEISLNVPMTICFLTCCIGETLLIYTERTGT